MKALGVLFNYFCFALNSIGNFEDKIVKPVRDFECLLEFIFCRLKGLTRIPICSRIWRNLFCRIEPFCKSRLDLRGKRRFQLTRDGMGKQWAVNSYRNAGLFEGLDRELPRRGIRLPKPLATLVAEHRAGPVLRDDLVELIRRIVRSD